MTKSTKTKDKLLEKIAKWSAEECLMNFSKFFTRVNLSTEFVQDDEGLIVAEVLIMNVDDKKIVSDPQPLEWPLLPAPLPEGILEDNGVKLN